MLKLLKFFKLMIKAIIFDLDQKILKNTLILLFF